MRERNYLATQRTETKRVQEISFAYFTQMGIGFTPTNNTIIRLNLILWPLIKKKDSSTINHIRLNSTYIQYLLNLSHPHNIMI